MAGYDYQSGMSNNALNAYDRGVKPLSKISVADLRAVGWRGSKGFAVYLAKKGVWSESEWHHSGGTWFNEVSFYDPESLMCTWDDATETEKAKWQNEFREGEKAPAPSVKVKGSYLEWGGSRRHPKVIGTKEFTGVLSGAWIHIDGGGRKKADGNHISFTRVAM